MFDSARWQSLKLKRVRYIVPWNWNKDAGLTAEVTAYMNRARAARQQVLVDLHRPQRLLQRPLLEAQGLPRAERARPTALVPGVRQRVPVGEDVLGVERGQPRLAADLQEAQAGRRATTTSLRKARAAQVQGRWPPTCSTRRTWRATCARSMRKAKGTPRLWGLHNYQDVNCRTSADTRLMLSRSRGEVWLTETGGIVKLRGRLPSTARRARPRARSRCSSWPTATTRKRARAALEDHAALRLLLVRRGARRALRRRPGEPGRRAAQGATACSRRPRRRTAGSSGSGAAVPSRVVNLYSDTQTRPTPAMRRAMAEAEVGDEQRFADPTVNALCERVADLLGHEAAVFLPSGTMCNAIAFRLHVRPGRRRGRAAPHLAPDHRRGGRAGRDLAAPCCARSRASAACSTPTTLRAHAAAAGRPLHPALAAGLARADDEHHRRPRLAAGADARRCSPSRARRACARTSTARG